MVLDATVAGPAANSYLTVAEADDLAATDPIYGDAWLKAALDEKERHLVGATLDVERYRRASGPRHLATQARFFPRNVDAGGTPAVPFLLGEVRRATYAQAAYVLVNGHLIRDAGSNRASGHLSRSDADGGFTQALSPTFGRYAPDMQEELDRIGAAGRTGRFLISVPIASSFPP